MSDYMNAKTENIQKFLDNCLKRQKHEIIKEILRDWKWGKVFEHHWVWINYRKGCKCKVSNIAYWKWFEKKWEDIIEQK